MPLISVIMPAYNASEFISEAIESVLHQTITDFELLICDDGSTDDTSSIIKYYSKKDKRIVLYENNINIGNLKTTNFIFSNCNGKYISLQDADDVSDPKRFEVLLTLFEKNIKLGIVGSYYNVIDSKNNLLQSCRLPLENKAIQEEMKKEVIPILYPSIMVKKEIANKAGFFQPFFNRKGYADFDWMARCAEVSEAENSAEILYSYRKHESSFTHKANYKKDLIYESMHLLLVSAHLTRIKGKKDFFETNDEKAMRNVICDYYIRRAENYYWEGDLRNALSKLWVAMKANVFEFKIYRTSFFILRKSLYKIW
jgi:glycosyltransferase involved in cell wall biosynthesis